MYTFLKNSLNKDTEEIPSCLKKAVKMYQHQANKFVSKMTKNFDQMNANDIVNAIKNISKKVVNKELNIEEINENIINNHLYTFNLPNVDLMIRTSGEKRISNFLLWQMAYAELYFTDVLWPDFRKEHFYDAIIDYQNRERRFGKTSEQITE